MRKPSKIILVDNDVVSCTRNRAMLAEHYEVFTVTGAHKLAPLLEKITPDLVVMDYDTLANGGLPKTCPLRSDPRWQDIPLMFIFNEMTDRNLARARTLGAQGFSLKNPILLKLRIEALIDDLRQRRHYLERIQILQEQVKQKDTQIFELQHAVFTGMANIVELRDDITGHHIERTKFYLEFLVNKLEEKGIYEKERCAWDQETLISSATLHDIGKVAIPDAILFKPGKLSDAEFEIMKCHASIGETILENMERVTSECQFLHHAKLIASSHHERWDGSGYPYGLKGEEIPLEGRLMAIADVYDAVISKRVYKEKRGSDEAERAIHEGSGKQFDPVLVEVFEEIAPLFADTARRFSDYEEEEQPFAYSPLVLKDVAGTRQPYEGVQWIFGSAFKPQRSEELNEASLDVCMAAG
ncbi:MAG: HD domain-containing protein [Coriobacteriales bacterium]|jgi:putative two-component system response regulator|nr:HD domain-containing protein [Coriobacteriales bacterium]